MKKTYISPSLRPSHLNAQMITVSFVAGVDNTNSVGADNSLGKDNEMDDVKPWYRQ